MRNRAGKPARRPAAWALAILAAVAGGGCNDTQTVVIDAVRYESDHFVVRDFAETPVAVVDSFLARLEADYAAVDAFFPTVDAPPEIFANILPGFGLPSMTIGEPELTQWGDNIAFDYIVHLLIHITTDYARGPLLEEGLAVYGTETLVPDSRTVDPYRGQVPHAWVSLFAGFGTTIPLRDLAAATAVNFDPNGSVFDASAWQFFLHAGSFARWVFDEFGAGAWWALYAGEGTEAALGLDTASAEAQWLAEARALHPTPLACREALGTVGRREELWCALAEGRVLFSGSPRRIPRGVRP